MSQEVITGRPDRVVVFSLAALTLCALPGTSEMPRPEPEISTTETSAEERVDSIVHGLAPPLQFEGEPVVRRDLTKAMAESDVPALALAIVDDCEVVWTGGWGTPENGRVAVTGSTPFQVGSVAKMVTAVVAMGMVAEGKLGIDQQINELLTSWKLPANELSREYPVLVRHLLSHSAGLTRTAYWLDRDEPMPDLAAILQGETGNPAILVEEMPGARALSSNSGFLVLQSLLQDVSALPLAALADKRLFTPLGMNSSAFEPVAQAFLDRGATNHGRDGGAFEGKAPLIPGAPGGLWSSVGDLARLVAELMKSWQGRSDELLPQEVARQMLSHQLGDMALGVHVRGEGEAFSMQQSGGGIGSLSHVIAYPELCRGAVIVVNTDGGRRVVVETLAAVGQEYGWPDLPFRVSKVKVPTSALESLSGRYRYDASPDSVQTFSVEGGDLFSRFGERSPFLVIPVSESLFVWPGNDSEIRFDPPREGVVPGVTIGTAGLLGTHLTRISGAN